MQARMIACIVALDKAFGQMREAATLRARI